jgi:hypothetical protein
MKKHETKFYLQENMLSQYCYTNEKKETCYQHVRTTHVQTWKNGPRATSQGKNARLKALKVLYHLAQLAYKEPCILYIMRWSDDSRSVHISFRFGPTLLGHGLKSESLEKG